MNHNSCLHHPFYLRRSFKIVEKLLFLLTFLLVLYANYMVFMVVPNERIMGPVQRIFYFHVGSAIASYFAVALVFMAALGHFANRNRFWDILSTAATEIGFLFCLIVMTTGMIWGHSAWNTWFRWEPRLVSFLILLLLFAAMNLLRWFGDREKVANHVAAFAILAAINVPLVIFSVKLLPQAAQLHPQVVQERGLRDPSFTQAMIVANLAMVCLMFLLVLVRTKIEAARREKD